MKIQSKSILWSNPVRASHYIVPLDRRLKSGEFEVRTVFGESQYVNEDQINTFEVTREEAKAWIKDELNGVVGEMKAAFANKISAAFERPSEFGERQTQDRTTAQTGDLPGLDLLAALSGSPKKKMREDPVELLSGVTQALEDFGAILNKSQSGSEVDLAEAKARMKRLRETFNRHGINVSDRADSLPDKLREIGLRRADRASDVDASKSSGAGSHGPDRKAKQ